MMKKSFFLLQVLYGVPSEDIKHDISVQADKAVSTVVSSIVFGVECLGWHP